MLADMFHKTITKSAFGLPNVRFNTVQKLLFHLVIMFGFWIMGRKEIKDKAFLVQRWKGLSNVGDGGTNLTFLIHT